MNGISRTQKRTTCSIADLEAWCAAVEVDFVASDYYITRVDRTYPPCLGCGGHVLDGPSNASALTVKADAETKTITTVGFQPCGCVLAVAGVPKGTQP